MSTSAELIEHHLQSWLATVSPSCEQLKAVLCDALFPGQRFRPALLLAAADPQRRKTLIREALAVELLHKASLIVDDIMDKDLSRAGRPTVVAAHGADLAVFAAHYLTAAALTLDTGGLERAYADMVEGQALDFELPRMSQALWPVYQRGMAKKVGSLFTYTLRASIPESDSTVLLRCLDGVGRSLGILYQICDDIEDLGCTESRPAHVVRHLTFPYVWLVDRGLLKPSAAPDPERTKQAWMRLETENRSAVRRHILEVAQAARDAASGTLCAGIIQDGIKFLLDEKIQLDRWSNQS